MAWSFSGSSSSTGSLTVGDGARSKHARRALERIERELPVLQQETREAVESLRRIAERGGCGRPGATPDPLRCAAGRGG